MEDTTNIRAEYEKELAENPYYQFVYDGEIIRNENNMIPLPGTLAKNYKVRVLNKTDF